MLKVFSRWSAIKLGCRIILFATGTAKVGIRFDEEDVVLLGEKLLPRPPDFQTENRPIA